MPGINQQLNDANYNKILELIPQISSPDLIHYLIQNIPATDKQSSIFLAIIKRIEAEHQAIEAKNSTLESKVEQLESGIATQANESIVYIAQLERALLNLYTIHETKVFETTIQNLDVARQSVSNELEETKSNLATALAELAETKSNLAAALQRIEGFRMLRFSGLAKTPEKQIEQEFVAPPSPRTPTTPGIVFDVYGSQSPPPQIRSVSPEFIFETEDTSSENQKPRVEFYGAKKQRLS